MLVEVCLCYCLNAIAHALPICCRVFKKFVIIVFNLVLIFSYIIQLIPYLYCIYIRNNNVNCIVRNVNCIINVFLLLYVVLLFLITYILSSGYRS